MNLAAALLHRGADLDQLLSQAKASLGLTSGDVLFACGSLAEGLGNRQSDIDLILITSRQDIAFTSLTEVFFTVGQCVVDVSVRQWDDVNALLHRFNRWAHGPRDPRGTFEFTEYERKFLHRLLNGQLLFGDEEYQRLQSRVSVADLAWHRSEQARQYAETLLIDLAGFREERDPHSMLFAAQELLSHTTDAWLAGHNYTNPIQKWRARHLVNLPAQWEEVLPGRRTGLPAIDRYLSLNRMPERITLRGITQYSLRIAAFSRSVFAWIERNRFYPDSRYSTLPVARESRSPDDRMSCLDLNVALRCHAGRFEVVRFNSGEAGIELSSDAALLLCLFDGETSRSDATDYANRLISSERGESFLEDLIALTQHAKFIFEEDVDEDLLQQTLGIAMQE